MCKLIVSLLTLLIVALAVATDDASRWLLFALAIMGVCCLALHCIVTLDKTVDQQCK